MTTLDMQRFELLSRPARRAAVWTRTRSGVRSSSTANAGASACTTTPRSTTCPASTSSSSAELLDCSSPEVVCGLLGGELEKAGVDPATLTGAGLRRRQRHGRRALADLGIESLVGVDLLPEARDAAQRDRPGLYEDYLALDLTDLDRDERARPRGPEFNAMTCVAALGFGDIPPVAFAEAFNLVESPGWIAFNMRERFLEDDDPAGFGTFIERMLDEGVLEERARMTYTHRARSPASRWTTSRSSRRSSDDVPLDWTQPAEPALNWPDSLGSPLLAPDAMRAPANAPNSMPCSSSRVMSPCAIQSRIAASRKPSQPNTAARVAGRSPSVPRPVMIRDAVVSCTSATISRTSAAPLCSSVA